MSAIPKPNYSTFDEPKRPRYTNETHYVIQCPSCQTKFAVEKSIIATVESPSFHCSRCDNIFSEDSLIDSKNQGATTTIKEETPLVKEPTESYSYQPQEKIQENLQSYYSSTSVPSVEQPVEQNLFDREVQIPNYVQTQSAPKINSGKLSQTKAFEIPASLVNGFTARPPHENHPTAEVENKAEQLPLTFEKRRANYWSKLKFKLFESATIHQSRNSSKEWRGVAVLTAPIIGFTLLLGALTAGVQSSSTISNTFSSLIAGSYNSIPSSLLIEESIVKPIVLESGESIFYITGRISNQGDRAIKDIHVEGILFDATGKVTAKQISQINSPLTKAKIKNLTPQMIKELQQSRFQRVKELKPKESGEFAIALINSGSQPIDDARYFSTRVYSAK